MGLFGIFGNKNEKGASSGQAKELQRLQKMVANKLSQNLDREDALYRLGKMASGEAARVLLTRFNWTLNPSIKDQEEKELAVQGIVAAGESALEPLRKYCVRTETITWPLKALRKIVSEDRLEQELLCLLDEFDTDYMRNPEPKVQLVQLLGECSSDDVRVAVQPFLGDLSELVRFAAVTTVLGCESEDALTSLVAALLEEESLRVKNRISVGIVSRGWKIPPDSLETFRDAMPSGFKLSADGSLGGSPDHQ